MIRVEGPDIAIYPKQPGRRVFQLGHRVSEDCPSPRAAADAITVEAFVDRVAR